MKIESGDVAQFCEDKNLWLYFSDYKMHPPQIWEESGGVSYSPKNTVYSALSMSKLCAT